MKLPPKRTAGSPAAHDADRQTPFRKEAPISSPVGTIPVTARHTTSSPRRPRPTRPRRRWTVALGAAVLGTALGWWLLSEAFARIAFERAFGGGALFLTASCALFVALVGVLLGTRTVYRLAGREARGGGR